MSRLTKQLAQDIVRRTMRVIGYNVNVMDRHGRIIGSGDPARLHQTHEGAVLAIQRQGRFEIDTESAAKLQGVQPGTNLVIEFQDEIVGVIGITGDPSEVTKYGELVKMTAEMYLEQTYLLEQAQWDKRMKEDFLLSIIHANQQDVPSLRTQAQRIGFQPDKMRVACMLELKEADDSDSLQTLKKVADLLEGRSAIDLIAVRNSQQVVLFKQHLHERQPHSDICDGIRQIRKWLDDKEIAPLRIAVGKPYSGIEGLMAAYQSAQDTMRVGRAVYPQQQVYYSDDLPNETFVANVNESWITQQLVALWAKFKAEDRSGELRQTLALYFAESGEQNRVADKLVIHRNTLRYRLQRIHELTGKDPRNWAELFTLMNASWLYAVHSQEENKRALDV